MHTWMFHGIRNHVFTYDLKTGYIACSCGTLGTRISKAQMVPTSERHVRNLTRHMGSLVLRDLAGATPIDRG